MTTKYILCGLICLLFSCLISPFVLSICKKLRASQSILHWVDKHAQKEGTPTMGGIIFLIVLIFSSLFLTGKNAFVEWFAIATTFAYGLLGFLDDFLKVKFRHNAGLRPYQKIFGQVGIGLIVGFYLYFSGRTSLTFFSLNFDIGWFVVPFSLLVLVATTNSVNLTDGLDGLAGGVSFVYILFFGLILALTQENHSLAILCFGMCGAILGYLGLNCFPAKIFMGDTGSLALGGFIGVVGVLSGLELYIPLMGVMFVLSALSDIIQVLHFKRTHKRVFLMAPLHHHFEQKGVHENRIVTIYIIVTTAVCLAVLMGVLAV